MFRSPFYLGVAALASTFFLLPASQAHVTLETPQAAINGSYKAVFRVPHGCKGSATTKLRIRIPEGVIGIKPQPKGGWTLETIKGDYTQAHQHYGNTVTSGVREVIWSGGPLADEHYDEFAFMAYLSADLTPDDVLYFPTIQECEEGIERWIDAPDTDSAETDGHSDSPAPRLQLLPRK